MSTVSYSRVSTTFHPNADLIKGAVPDVILLSSDAVRFHVHTFILGSVSTNGFGGIFNDGCWAVADSDSNNTFAAVAPFVVEDDANVLNIILHTAYCLSTFQYAPDLPTLCRATTALVQRYGLPGAKFVGPGTALATALLSHSRSGGSAAFTLFTLAARNRLETLAVAASERCHAFEISSLTDEKATELGGVYLKRLVLLLLSRVEALKRLLVVAPGPLHPPTTICGPEEQQRDVSGPWAHAVVGLIMDARADTAPALLESVLNPLVYRCACSQCRDSLRARVKEVIDGWKDVKKTI